MTPQDREMHAILLRLEMLASGSTQAWNASGGGSGEPDDKMVSIVVRGEKPLHVYWRERYENAHKPESKDAVIAAARKEADDWAVRSTEARGIAGDANATLEDMIVSEENEGVAPEVLAHRFNLPVAQVRRMRQRRQVSTEDGREVVAQIEQASMAEKRAQALRMKADGLTMRQIALNLRVGVATVKRYLDAA